MKIVIKGLVDNCHMGLGHEGLQALCLSNFGMDLTKLKPGEVVVFLNRDKTKLKLMGAENKCLGYLRMHRGEKIDLHAVQYLPQAFGGHGFDYSEALKKSMLAKLAAKYVRGAPTEHVYGASNLTRSKAAA